MKSTLKLIYKYKSDQNSLLFGSQTVFIVGADHRLIPLGILGPELIVQNGLQVGVQSLVRLVCNQEGFHLLELDLFRDLSDILDCIFDIVYSGFLFLWDLLDIAILDVPVVDELTIRTQL